MLSAARSFPDPSVPFYFSVEASSSFASPRVTESELPVFPVSGKLLESENSAFVQRFHDVLIEWAWGF